MKNLLEGSLAWSHLTLYIIGTLTLAVIIHLVMRIFHIYYKRYKEMTSLKHFKGPDAHWLHGSIRLNSTMGKTHEWSVENMERYGPAFLIHNGPIYRIIELTSPEYIQCVMSTSEPKDDAYNFLKPWIGEGLLTSKGRKWVRNRRLLTPAFHFDILKPYQELFSQSANVLADKWENLVMKNPDTCVEMFEHVSLMTLDSLMKCIFGVDSNFQVDGKKNPYINAVYVITELILKRIRNPMHHNDLIYYFTRNGFAARKALKVAHAFTSDVIQKKRKQSLNSEYTVEPNGSKRYLDFLDMLLSCRDSEGQGLTDLEIQDEVDTFMFEGHDTTASGISWCLYNLASHEDIQEKCRHEVNRVLGDKTRVDWDDLGKLNFLTMCIKESMRTHPPVSGIGRTTTKEHTLPDGRVIPKGTWVKFGIYACHRNRKVWVNPDVYDPYRFAQDESQKRHSHAFIPFSSGPRNCIGQHFAMNEMKTVVSLIIKRFVLTVDETRQPEPHFTLIFRSKNGIWLKLKPIVST